MSLFNTYTISFRRPGAGEYIQGRWVDGTETELTCKGSVQPLTGLKLEQLMMGARCAGAIVIYTATRLYTADPLAKRLADIVIFDGKEWIVYQVEPWQNGILPHFRVSCVREKEVEIDGQ